MKKQVLLVLFMALTAFLLGAVTSAWAEETEMVRSNETIIKKSTLVEKVKGGEIDWGNEMIYAAGEGVMPKASQEPNRAKAYLMAKSFARMQAIANLLMVIEGTAISYEGYGKDYMAQDETLRQKIEGFVRGVEILRDEKVSVEGDTVVKVTVGTKIYGKANPGTAFLERIAQQPTPNLEGAPAKVVIDIPKEAAKKTEPVAAWQQGPFTSVIIDTRGFRVTRAMSPKIRRTDGSEVWGTIRVSPEFALETGIVSYAVTMEMARNSTRCGSNPLIIKAIGRAGGKAMCDVVISDEDATLLLEENNKTKFLDQCKVIFIVDAPNSLQSGRK